MAPVGFEQTTAPIVSRGESGVDDVPGPILRIGGTPAEQSGRGIVEPITADMVSPGPDDPEFVRVVPIWPPPPLMPPTRPNNSIALIRFPFAYTPSVNADEGVTEITASNARCAAALAYQPGVRALNHFSFSSSGSGIHGRMLHSGRSSIGIRGRIEKSQAITRGASPPATSARNCTCEGSRPVRGVAPTATTPLRAYGASGGALIHPGASTRAGGGQSPHAPRSSPRSAPFTTPSPFRSPGQLAPAEAEKHSALAHATTNADQQCRTF
jgi:hypothetical protein